MCDKGVDTCRFVFLSIPEWYKAQKVCDKSFFQRSFWAKIILK